MRRLIVSAVLSSFCACAAAQPQYPAQPNERPPNYRAVIKRALAKNEQQPRLPNVSATAAAKSTTRPLISDKFAPYQVSGVRQVDTLEDWSWLVCLLGENKGSPVHIAVFIRADQIVEARLSVFADQCAQQTYEKL